MTWSTFYYRINQLNGQNSILPNSNEQSVPLLPQNHAFDEIKEYIEKYTEHYLIALHYLDVPIIITYSSSSVPEGPLVKRLKEYFEPVKEVTRILMQDKAEVVKGFHFLRHAVQVRKSILEATDQETFDLRAANSGLETYVINDLRTVWKNSRLQYLKKSLPKQYETLYLPNKEHPIYANFVDFLKKTYARGVDRFKAYICVGSSFIGKSVFFMKFIVPEKYYIYHSNNLEYSKMPDQPHKIFRILDDINWGAVSDMEFKALLNRNISSVDVKYSYEYLFPLIPIIIMNKEDYNTFRTHFSAIWEFVERNAVIYPPQTTREAIQEEQPLFTQQIANENYEYLFDSIVHVQTLNEIDYSKCSNLNEWIKKYLDQTEGYYYDAHRYMQLPMSGINKIPNPSLDKKSILEQYDEYILKKKKLEMEKPLEKNEENKKPRYPLQEYYSQYNRNGGNKRNRNFLNTLDYQRGNRYKRTRYNDYDNEYDYNEKYDDKYDNDYNNEYDDKEDKKEKNSMEQMDDDFSDISGSNSSFGDSDGSDDYGDSDGGYENDGGNDGFVEL